MTNYGSKESFIFLDQVTRGAKSDEEIGQAWMMRYGLGNRVEQETMGPLNVPYNRASFKKGFEGPFLMLALQRTKPKACGRND